MYIFFFLSEVIFFCLEFGGDIYLAYTLSYLILEEDWRLKVCVIFLWIFPFLIYVASNCWVLYEGRHTIFCSLLEHLGLFQLWLVEFGIVLLAPLILRFLHARQTRQIQQNDNSFSEFCQMTDTITPAEVAKAISLHKDHTVLMGKHRAVGLLLASSYKVLLWGKYLQLMFQIIIVFIAYVPVTYPWLVTWLEGWLDIWPEMIFLVYLSFTWAHKRARSILLKTPTGKLTVQIKGYVIQLKKVGLRLALLYLFLVPPPGLSCNINPVPSDLCLTMVDKYGPVVKSDIPRHSLGNHLFHLLMWRVVYIVIALLFSLTYVFQSALQDDTNTANRLTHLVNELFLLIKVTARNLFFSQTFTIIVVDEKENQMAVAIFAVYFLVYPLFWAYMTYEPIFSLPYESWLLWYLFFMTKPDAYIFYLCTSAVSFVAVGYQYRHELYPHSKTSQTSAEFEIVQKINLKLKQE